MELSQESKVWIYQSDREFTEAELQQLTALLTDFTSSWTAHNQELKASFKIAYNRFIILLVDETLTGASGCSIDKSVRLMKDIEQEFGINLFDRFNIAWKEEDMVKTADRATFENLVKNNSIHAQTTVFNNLVKTLGEFEASWETPLENSWHARFFL
ncbi:ABC transporter ATPase [Pseudopedobacter beijingensis]|uniref:ABC transporter ATPase n=1 Tax=Pseudopedobacter beijingensis TaxID=1207056 RepID=A0ABW4I8V0_9SPHI